MSVHETASLGRAAGRRRNDSNGTGGGGFQSQLENAGSGFASLLRAASRKSSESLRSVRSAASRRGKSEGASSRPGSRSTIYSDAPPVPRIYESDKHLPMPPKSNDPFGAARGAQRVRREDATPTPSFRSAQNGSEGATPTPSDAGDIKVGSVVNIRGAPSHSQSSAAQNIIEQQRRAEERRRRNSSDGDAYSDQGGARTPTARSVAGEEEDQVDPEKTYEQGNYSQTSLAKSMRKGGKRSKHSVNGSAANLQPLGEEVHGEDGELRVSSMGDGNTVAQLYAVFGLPKDPSVWTLAEEDCVAGVHHIEGAVGRFWRPEVLGCSICPSPAEVLSRSSDKGRDKESGAAKWEGRNAEGKKPQNPKFIEMADGRGGVERAETARVLSKALKLSFTREIEIVSGQANFPPMASSHTFSFSVPTTASSGESLDTPAGAGRADARKATGAVGVSVGKANAARGVGEGYGLERGAGQTAADGSTLATFFGVVLTVWSAADDRRAKTIKRELTRAARQRNASKAKRAWSGGETDTGDNETGADETGESDGYSFLPAHNTFFMPYAICIVSRYPLYDLLGDWNKMAWHKYSRNIEMHNQQMATILRQPAPRLGERFQIDTPTNELTFICKFPGALEWGTGLIGIDFSMWPIFKTLSLDTILSVCEIALAPNGRVLFQSRHPALLGLAVETIKHLVELRGWRGVANQNCHARDVRIYLEDPGSWIIAINTELRSIVKPAPEVCVVDLDINYMNCARPPKDAPSSGKVRERRRRKLAAGIQIAGIEYAPPRQFVEAYPGGRFRPVSKVMLRERNSAYEQLERPSWFDQGQAITAFDVALQDTQRSTFLQKVLKNRASKAGAATEAELAAILALRRRASTFVDARDGLENKIGRLNKRLAFLMSESDMWKQQFSKIQQLVDRLTREANDLRSKVDKERRESRRLSSTLAQRDMEQVQIQLRLKETETAREAAQGELSKMQKAMETLELEREAMMDEIRQVISGAGADDADFNMSRFDIYAQAARAGSPTGSQVSQTASQQAESILRHRTQAEMRISEGRRSRSGHEGSSKVRSLSQDRGERQRRGSNAASSQVHNFPDEQMNHEIQARTSVVTDQIARIQQQLESTLTNLEGRRSGTYEREGRRRDRRTSNASISSMRYEYGIPSSIGHGGDTSDAHYRAPSSVGGGGGGMTTDDDAATSDMDGGIDHARLREKRAARAARREARAAASAAPTSFRGIAPQSSNTNLRTSSAASEAQTNSGALSPGVKVQPREREPSNPWKEMATRSSATTNSTSNGAMSPATGATSPDISTTSHVGGATSPNGNGAAISASNSNGSLNGNGSRSGHDDVDATPRAQPVRTKKSAARNSVSLQ